MKLKDDIGIFYEAHTISPEAFKAQRLAELADLAEFRARRLFAIRRWSEDPTYREEFMIKADAESKEVRADVARRAAEFAKWFDEKDHKNIGATRLIYKPFHKQTWFERLADWIGQFFR